MLVNGRGGFLMKTMMDAAVLNKPLEMEVKKLSIPKPRKNEALIKVYCIGICGSDIHYYEHGKIGRYEVKEPLILGHEVAGEVVEVGEEVQNVMIGDRVAIEPGVTCGRCDACKSGRYNLCPDVAFMATPPVDGAWAEYVTVRSDFLFKLPDEISYEAGALLEPLSVGIHAMNRGNITPADRLLITGLGPIGLLAAQAAKMFGVNDVYATDVVPFRRELGLDLGITNVIDPSRDDLQKNIEQWTDGKGVNVVIETSGNAKAIQDAFNSVNRGGRIVCVGMPVVNDIPVNINHMIDSELDVYGVFRYANTYPTAIQALKNPHLDIEKVITHQFALTDIQEAVDVARNQKDTSIKVMIYPGK